MLQWAQSAADQVDPIIRWIEPTGSESLMEYSKEVRCTDNVQTNLWDRAYQLAFVTGKGWFQGVRIAKVSSVTAIKSYWWTQRRC